MPNRKPFCANPKCCHHAVLVDDRTPYIMVDEGNFCSKRVERHMYWVAEALKVEVCEVCHSAIQLLKRR